MRGFTSNYLGRLAVVVGRLIYLPLLTAFVYGREYGVVLRKVLRRWSSVSFLACAQVPAYEADSTSGYLVHVCKASHCSSFATFCHQRPPRQVAPSVVLQKKKRRPGRFSLYVPVRRPMAERHGNLEEAAWRPPQLYFYEQPQH